MTALNIWHDQHAAWMLTDTAITDRANARVLSIEPKVISVDVAGAMALAVTGTSFTPAMLRCWAHGVRFACPADLISSLPEFLAALDIEMRLQHPSAKFSAGIAAAVYDPHERRPLLFAIGNDEEWLGDGYEPFKLLQVGYWTTGAEPFGPFTHASPVADTAAFDPERDGLAMIEAQRRSRWGDGSCRVGGAAVLTRVGREGVTSKVLREWPDKVGQRIAA